MIKFLKILCLSCVLSVGAFAQTDTDEYKKNEFYAGYSNQQIDNGNYRTTNGFQGSYVRNVHRYFGIKADVSGAYRNDTFYGTGTDTSSSTFTYRQKLDSSLYNFLGGVQVKNNASKARFKPFAHALAGAAVTRDKFTFNCTSANCPTGFNFTGATTNTHFAMAFGGGLDIKINDRIDFRAIQVDYNPIFRNGGNWQHNVRLGIGVVFK